MTAPDGRASARTVPQSWRVARRCSAREAGAEAGLLPSVDVRVEFGNGVAEPCECVVSQDEHQRRAGMLDGGDDRLGCPGWVTRLVSRLVAALERQVGATLFERTSRRMALTPLGAQFRDELALAYTQMQAALDHARCAAREAAGQLRVGSTTTTEGPALSRLRARERSHPRTRRHRPLDLSRICAQGWPRPGAACTEHPTGSGTGTAQPPAQEPTAQSRQGARFPEERLPMVRAAGRDGRAISADLAQVPSCGSGRS